MKSIKYILTIFILFFISIVKINALNLKVGDDGVLTCDNTFGYCDGKDDWYEMDDDTLFIKKAYDSSDATSSFNLEVSSPITIIVSKDVYIPYIYTSDDIVVKSENKNNSSRVNFLNSTNDSNLIIEDANFIIGSGIQSFSSVKILNSTIKKNGNVAMSINSNSSSVKEEIVIKDSYVELYQILDNRRVFELENSTIIATDSISVGVEVEWKNSTIQAKGISFLSSDSSNPNYNHNKFDNVIINVNDIYSSMNSSTNNFKFKDSKISTGYVYGSINAEFDNCELNVAYNYNQGSIIAKDSKLKVKKMDNSYFLSLNNSSFEGDNAVLYNYYPTETGYSDYSFMVIDSTLNMTGNVSSNNAYFQNSDVEMGDLDLERYGSSSINNYTFTSQKCNVNMGKLQSNGDITINYSTINIGGILIKDNDYNDVPDGNLKINESKLHVNDISNNSVGITINDLVFQNSYLISEGTSNAWLSSVDVTTHDLVGINKSGSIIPMNINNNNYSFYDDNNISKYVEIRTPLKITFKIENGTWSDGTTEDKVIDSYYFGVLTNSQIPSKMIANKGYGKGSWDKTIITNDITHEDVYTYRFREVDEDESDDDSDDEKEDDSKSNESKKEELKNPDTGVFIPMVIICILIALCILILKYTSKKKLFRKL